MQQKLSKLRILLILKVFLFNSITVYGGGELTSGGWRNLLTRASMELETVEQQQPVLGELKRKFTIKDRWISFPGSKMRLSFLRHLCREGDIIRTIRAYKDCEDRKCPREIIWASIDEMPEEGEIQVFARPSLQVLTENEIESTDDSLFLGLVKVPFMQCESVRQNISDLRSSTTRLPIFSLEEQAIWKTADELPVSEL